jgi:phosphatidyl-myo-inositol dimannoside synthase
MITDTQSIRAGGPMSAASGSTLAGRRVFLGAGTLEPGRGGICRVARMTAATMSDAGAQVRVASLLDSLSFGAGLGSVAPSHGSKVRFLVDTWRESVRSDAFVYDHIGLSRAHPRLIWQRKPVAVWVHGIEVWENAAASTIDILRGRDFLIAHSHYSANRIQSLHGAMNITIVPLATEDDSPPGQMADFSGPPMALMLGRIDGAYAFKGHGEVIDAWQAVVAAVPNARLVIVGGGPALDEVRGLAEKSPARAQIDVLGFVPEEAMPALWAKAHALVMPSRREGFGLVYVEAMRFGVPVVASLQDAGIEVNRAGETGVNVDLDKPKDLPDQLVALLGDTNRCAALGAGGARHWAAHYRVSQFKARLKPVLETAFSAR